MTIGMMIQPAYIPMATNVRFAQRFKEELDIPVVTVGSFNMELAEEALATGKADMVAMIRGFIADPDLVNKAKDGIADEIRPCIRCCSCTGDPDPHASPKPIRCSVNPLIGREAQITEIPKAAVSKKVIIVGGGCAGMEAARWLAVRGHEPIIIEKDAQLGGSLIPAAANPIKGDVSRYLDWSVNLTEKMMDIEVRKNTLATKALIEAENPDALIIATGSSPIIPKIPGIIKDKVVLAMDVDMGKAIVGKQVVLAGAGLTGTETALTLANQGHQVTVIDMKTVDEIDQNGLAGVLTYATLRGMAAQAGVLLREQVKLIEVTDDGVVIEKEDGTTETLLCDTVVLSLGVKPNCQAIEELTGLVADTRIVGDCTKPGNITSAVREGFYAALNIN